MKTSLGFFGIVVALLLATAACADPVDTSLCRNEPDGAAASFGFAKAVGPGKVYLHDCPPGASDCTERGKQPYVVAGDTVITGIHVGGKVCAFFFNKIGGSQGWVDENQLSPLPTPPAPLEAWRGHWSEAGDDTVDLKVVGAALSISGSACWPGCHVSVRERPGGPNVGDLGGKATPHGNQLSLGSDDDCHALMWLMGQYLLVFDNHGCGGMNVTFQGVYTRKAAH